MTHKNNMAVSNTTDHRLHSPEMSGSIYQDHELDLNLRRRLEMSEMGNTNHSSCNTKRNSSKHYYQGIIIYTSNHLVHWVTQCVMCGDFNFKDPKQEGDIFILRFFRWL